MLRALNRNAVWKRTVMGDVLGLDMSEAMASLPACDREFARRLFAAAEPAFLRNYRTRRD